MFYGEPIHKEMPPDKMWMLVKFLVDDNARLYKKHESYKCKEDGKINIDEDDCFFKWFVAEIKKTLKKKND